MDRSEKGQPEGLLAEFALLLPHDESRILSPQQLPRVRRERSIEGMVSQFGWLQQAVLAPRPGSRVRRRHGAGAKLRVQAVTSPRRYYFDDRAMPRKRPPNRICKSATAALHSTPRRTPRPDF